MGRWIPLIFFSWSACGIEVGADGEGDAYIARVRESFLAFNPRAELGLVLRGYPWFEKRTWSFATENGVPTVTFVGVVDDAKAVADFEARNKYRWRDAFKSMQLQAAYPLTRDKRKLSFAIHFAFEDDARNFKIAGGTLGVQRESDGVWVYETLEQRELDALIEGLFGRQDPYLILVRGLPYK
ncbi:hypothetical protein SCOR_10565 [Sulfidibacter corallicola]|uniref:Lipoprotein n=1 Tax=Sulfidibacter corallicola TaxID=2818388 RepID=A0A8A4TF08_SULCO|nr:hypothetical protein [Sulfidibacter corallicola]QTD48223.1 hypothetical protein J3U87_21775 [Sulfidibacter corallicola]